MILLDADVELSWASINIAPLIGCAARKTESVSSPCVVTEEDHEEVAPSQSFRVRVFPSQKTSQASHGFEICVSNAREKAGHETVSALAVCSG